MLYAGQNLVHLREDSVDGVGPWIWARTDIHAWNALKRDWEISHKQKIINHVSNKRVVVQAGGNMGMYPRLLSTMFERVYTFEPDPVNFHCLVANCQRDNIVKLNAALGPSHQLVNVSKDQFEDWDTNYGIRTVVPDQSGVTPMLKIDDLALDQCDLIMLDVEGYELKALKGAVETIENFGPVVFAEQHPGCDSIEPFLRAFGYSVIDYSFHDMIFKK
jgi:FkbM family methyltransferase